MCPIQKGIFVFLIFATNKKSLHAYSCVQNAIKIFQCSASKFNKKI